MPFPYLGEACALLAPLAWACAVILYKQSTSAPPEATNLFKNLVGLALLSVTLAVTGTPIPTDRPPLDWLRLAVSGILGLAVADTLLFAALRRLGAARLAVVDIVYAPTVVGLSWLLLDEALGPAFLLGALAVLVGVGLATVDRSAMAAERPTDLRVGVALGLATVSGTAVGIVIARPVLEGSALFEVTWTRLLFGLAAQAAWTSARGGWAEILPILRPSPLWRTLLPGTVLGAYVSLVLWLGGFKWAHASVAAVLNQMATIYILVLARLVLAEPVSARRVVGAGIAVAGAAAIVLVKG